MMKNLVKIWVGCGLLLSIGSCGGRTDHIEPSRVTKDGVPIYDYASYQEALEEYKQWTVLCKDSASCPDSVGQLVVLEGSSISLCTATLVEEDVILTNSHCFNLRDKVSNRFIPEDELCANGASIVFPSNSPTGRDLVPCGQVLKKSFLADVGRYPDYMLIKLQRKLKRSFQPVMRLGLKDGQVLTMHKINPKNRGLGELETLQCEILHRTAVIPGANSDDFYIHVAKNCQAAPGNSGSALLDEEGQVRGIMFAGIIKYKDVSRMNELDKKIHFKSVELNVALVTNATCIDYDFPNTSRFNFERCFKNMSERGDVQDLVDKSQFRRRVERSLLDINSQLPESLGYSLFHREGQLVAYSAPSCFNKEFDQKEVRRRDKSLEAPVIFWQTDYSITDRLQPSVEVQPTFYGCRIRWSPQQLNSTRQTNVELIGTTCFDSSGNILGGIREKKDTWGLCQP